MGNFLEEIITKDLKTGAVNNIITRFPPEPNGYLHIGHAKSICLNFTLAKKFSGECNLRFDDTNPAKEEDEYVRSIIEDVEWLGFSGKVFYASDYFEVMYNCAETLIKKGLAYVDDITAERLREERGTLTEPGKESAARNKPSDENLALFRAMRDGKFADGEVVLRAKIDMASANMNMRDPVIYRVLRAHHHRQGDKWCIYPMYDFAHPIEDAVEKISHSICTLEFEDHRPLYDWVLEHCGFEPRPHQYEFARLNITRTIMSKRYLKKLVDDKAVEGWDDPRMPTLAGLRRRGFTSASVREFCERIGVAKSNSEVEVAQLESCIREELNLNAQRAMAVLDPIELVITNRPDDYSEELDFEYSLAEEKITEKITMSNRLYIDKADFCVNPPPKYHRLTPNGVVRLKSAYIIKCTGYDTDLGGEVTRVYAEVIEGSKSGGSGECTVKAKGVIHFADAKNCIDAVVREYDYLLTESGELNPDSLIVKNAKVANSLTKAEKGSRFQFMRAGYYCRDTKSEGLVFNKIVGLKDSFTKK